MVRKDSGYYKITADRIKSHNNKVRTRIKRLNAELDQIQDSYNGLDIYARFNVDLESMHNLESRIQSQIRDNEILLVGKDSG